MRPNKNFGSRFGNIAAVTLLIPLMMWGFWSESPLLPVTGAASKDWHPDTFWYEPWGSSGVHKGMDIFAPKGQMLVAPVPMLRLWRGELSKGGKVILALGPGFKLHYFAHLDSFEGNRWWLAAGSPIGTVGDSGNAKGKPPHLHYSLVSLLPRPWRLDFTTQGYKRCFTSTRWSIFPTPVSDLGTAKQAFSHGVSYSLMLWYSLGFLCFHCSR